MKPTTLRRLLGDQRGQIMPLFVFLLVMTLGIFVVSHEIGRKATRRIQLQTAADVGAMAGARAQALGFEFMALTNDLVSGHMAKIMYDLATFYYRPVSAVLDIVKQVKGINACHAMQGMVSDAYFWTLPVEAATMLSNADPINADVVFSLWPILTVSTPQLRLARPWWTLGLYMHHDASDVNVCDYGATVFKDEIPNVEYAKIPCQGTGMIPWQDVELLEKVTAISLDINKGVTFGDVMTGDPDSHPKMTAVGSASPYWVLGSDFPFRGLGYNPRDPLMMPQAAILSMMLPGPFWSTRLRETGDLPEWRNTVGGLGGWVWGMIRNKYIWGTIKQKSYKWVTDKLPQTQGSSGCFRF